MEGSGVERCHRGHETVRALWDCPVCVGDKIAAKDTEIQRLRARIDQFAGPDDWPRTEAEERKLEDLVESIILSACSPLLTPAERAGKLLAAWRNYWGIGGLGLFSRLRAAEDLERVINAALLAEADAIKAALGEDAP